MKLLVVGASGFLGRNILRLASRKPWDVVGSYHESRDFPAFARRYGCTPVRHNLLARSRAWDADVCIYTAGTSDHLAASTSPVEDLQTNVEALCGLAGGFRGGLVFLGSAAVYDGHVGQVSPATPLRPTMPYAISKLACERYVDHFVASGSLEWATVLRLYYAFGPNDRPRRLIARLVRAALAGEKKFVVTAPRGGLIDPMYSEDVARAALRATKGIARGETLDLCAGQPRPVATVVRKALDAGGWRMRLISRPRPMETVMRFYSDPRHVRRALRLGSWLPFEDGVRHYARFLLGRDKNGG